MTVTAILDALGMDDRRRMYIGYRFHTLIPTYSRRFEGTTARFHVGTFREYRRIRTLMYEQEALSDVLQEVSADDVFYDIGANVGVYTSFVGQHVDQVIAIEPHEETAARLRENVSVNNVDATVYECAFAAAPGATQLTHPRRSPDDLGSGEFSLVADDDAVAKGQVTALRGAELIRREGLPEPSVVKIDVEGAELETLDGLDDSLASCRLLYVEVHRDHVDLAATQAKLTELGFHPAVFLDRGNTTFVKATRNG